LQVASASSKEDLPVFHTYVLLVTGLVYLTASAPCILHMNVWVVAQPALAQPHARGLP
jgi:hypothetical protein